MNFLPKPLVRILCLGAALVAMPGFTHAATLPPAGLRSLAARAARRETWPLLRNYAKSQTDHEWRGWAYFLAGYQEFEGQVYPQAAQDLAQAAESGFSLVDYAVFYQASALRQANRPLDAAAVLQDFAARFPGSHLRYKALELRASALLIAEQPQPAIDALVAEPETHKQPALALLLGQAYIQAHNPEEAATTFKNVYYNFPLSSQAKAAGDALPALRQQLGLAYQEPDVGLRRTRADALSAAGRGDDALNEFDKLMKDEPASPMLPYWQVGQARCFLRMHRTADALQALAIHFAVPDLEAQRLALLVRVHAQQSDAAAITQDLAQLEASYALYPAHADALSAAGIFYYRQLNWQEAARAYQRLWELFPQNDRLREDGWRLAWCEYLLGDPKTAEVMQRYLMQFPDSSRAPAALYWLGRTQEDQGSFAEARALYALLTKRFVHTYYALQAAARMAAMGEKPGSVQGADGSPPAPLAAALVPMLAPPVIPSGLACLATVPSDAARPALILQAMDLKSLEEDFLKAALAEENPPAELRLLLAGVYATEKAPAEALFNATRAAPAYPQVAFSDLPKEVWDFLYPQAYWKLVQSQARLNHLDPYLVMGLIRQESAFSPRALSSADARGLMQILPETAAHSSRPSRTRYAKRRLYDPNYNVRVGCAYLAGLLKQFDGRRELAMAAYNAGDFRVSDWVTKYTFRDPTVFMESIPIPATRVYVEQVLRDAEVYRQLLSGSPHFAKCSESKFSAPAAHEGR
ncbi:MAG TPA: transglycosylase SLT domain-containing protein [Terriglobia bacterium]|nr:transglycosylase SLT domain-containing protein [Terriglobia bacterium]